MKLLCGFRGFLSWLLRVVRKGWVLLGPLPSLLDYVSAYVSADFRPPPIADVLESGLNWQCSLAAAVGGLLVSAFLVHSETEARLAEYEDQEPKYEVTVLEEPSSSICRPGTHVHVSCKFRMKYLNSWPGFLARAVVEPERNVGGLGAWEVTDILRLRQGQESHLPQRNLPYLIPHPECHFEFRVQAAIAGQPGARARKRWKNVLIPLRIQVQHVTQSLGAVPKLLPLDVRVDLGKEFDTILASLEDRTI